MSVGYVKFCYNRDIIERINKLHGKEVHITNSPTKNLSFKSNHLLNKYTIKRILLSSI